MLKGRIGRAAVAVGIAGGAMFMTTGVASADNLGSNAPGEVQLCQFLRKNTPILDIFDANQGQCIKFVRTVFLP